MYALKRMIPPFKFGEVYFVSFMLVFNMYRYSRLVEL